MRIRLNRLTYLYDNLSKLSEPEQPDYFISTVIGSDENSINVDKIKNETAKNPFACMEKIDDDWMVFEAQRSYSFKKSYEQGDNNKIFQYCKNNLWALRTNWVLDEIKKWQMENTRESINKTKKLLSRLVELRGKKPQDKTIELLQRDKKIYEQIKRLNKNKPLDDIFGQLCNKKCRSEETLKEIYREFGNIEKLYRTIRKNWRLYYVGFPKQIPYWQIENNIVLQKVLGIKDFADSLGWQLEVYKKIRFKESNVEYKNNKTLCIAHWGIRKNKNINKNEIMKQLSKRGEISIRDINEIYNDFNEHEMLRNPDYYSV